jgi:hypothetical protein
MASESHASTALPSARPGVARYFNELRLASYVLVLYALGHTMGAVVNTPSFGVASDAVVIAMKSVHVEAQGSDCTWYGFYRGFGIIVTVYFLSAAAIAWHLGGLAADERRKLAVVTWTLFLGSVACVIVCWAYFFAMPLLFALAAAALFGVACFRQRASGGSGR